MAYLTSGDPLWDGKPTDTRHLRHYTYDSLGRLVTVQDPNAGTTSYTFDDIGRVTLRRDPLGQAQEWIYGKAGRLNVHRVSATPGGASGYEHAYHYDVPAPDSPIDAAGAADLRGRLSWLEFPTGREHYGYDELGRVSREVHELWNPSTSSFEAQARDRFERKLTYRADGMILRNIAPGGLELDYSYDERNAVTGLSSSIGNVTRSILAGAAYDHRRAMVRSDFGNGIRSCNSFNERGELTSFRAGKANQIDCDSEAASLPGGFHNLHYVRGHDGLIDAIEDRSAANTGLPRLDADYEYDAIQQLVGVTDPRGSVTYTYDSIQNLVRREVANDIAEGPVGEIGYGVDAGPNAVTHAGAETYSYDAAGQMERYNGYDLRFDPEGHLVEANNPATGVRLVQHYDDAGERRIGLVYRTGRPVEVHRFVTPDFQIRDGEEVWLTGAAGVSAEIVRSRGVLVDAALLDQLTQYVNGAQREPKPLPAEYMDLNGDGVSMNAVDLAVAQQGYVSRQRGASWVGGHHREAT